MKLLISLSILFGIYTSSFSANISVLSSETGRYVFGQISETRKDQYLLDTKTGKLWNVMVKKNGDTYLSPMPIDSVHYDKNGKAKIYTNSTPK